MIKAINCIYNRMRINYSFKKNHTFTLNEFQVASHL